jgi:hypothetical protein
VQNLNNLHTFEKEKNVISDKGKLRRFSASENFARTDPILK